MRRFFGKIENDKMIIEGDEFNHLKNAVRLSIGDEFLALVDDNFEYACQVKSFEKKHAVCEILGKTVCEANPKKNIVLFQAITKRPKFEFIVQKATEIGISKIVPFVSSYSISKNAFGNVDRLKTIVVNACKQCERSILPEICEIKTAKEIVGMFKDFDIVLFANERADVGDKFVDVAKAENIAIIVGAEGGFDQKEKEMFIEAKATSISLGKRIYRCETASVAMMSLASILSGN